MSTADAGRSTLPSRSPPLAARCLLAIVALAVVTYACGQLHVPGILATAALLYMVIIVLLSLSGSFVAAALVSVVAVFCLAYFFFPPRLALALHDPLDAVAIVTFLVTALVVTRLVTRMRNSVLALEASLDDRKHAEEAARRQAALLNLTHDTIFVRDMKDVITFWNRGAEDLYGWAADQAVGGVTHQLLKTEFPMPLEEITAQLTRTGRWEGELTHTRRDGSTVIVASRWALQRDEQGRPVATLETNNDITARRRAEEELSRSQAQLIHVTRVTTLGELAASIAHEVNQPLTAIVADANAALNWCAMENVDLRTVRETLTEIVKNGARAGEVLTRIRDLLSRRSSQPYERCDLSNVVRGALPLVRSELARHGIRVHIAFADEQTYVMADRIQLQQVLVNLLMNAADASKEVAPERRQLVVSAAVEAADGGTHAVVGVRDEGIGIDAADRARLFDAFYTTKASGLGMGLSISRSIIERHGGRLWMTPNAVHGTTFHFALPVAS